MRKERPFYEIRSHVTCICKVDSAYTNVRMVEIVVGAMENTINLSVTKIQDPPSPSKGFGRPPKEEVKDDKSKTHNLTTTTISNDLPFKVILQTATTHAHAQDSNKTIPVRVVLNGLIINASRSVEVR